MTKDEALKLALEALHYCEALNRPVHEQKIHAIKAIKEALDECDEDELIIRYHEMTIKRLEKRIEELTVQPTSGDYALGYAEGFNDACKPKPAKEAVAWEQFHEHLVERNFCPRCGKRTADLTTIHTCTPPRSKA
jgi:hypothetical protein